MPMGAAESSRASITTLFKPVSTQYTIAGIDEMLNKYSDHQDVGIAFIRVGLDGRQLNRANLPKMGAELAHVVLENYVKPVVTAPELQYLFPSNASDATVAVDRGTSRGKRAR